jgi:hypothetical protein
MEVNKRKPYPPVQLRGVEGYVETINITNSDSNVGVINMATETVDFLPVKRAEDDSFLLCVETAAPIKVQLIGQKIGEFFIITAAQAQAYLGKWYPAKIARVYKDGTTGQFSIGF